jgi:succinyl-diaminopimelate desuccinylase
MNPSSVDRVLTKISEDRIVALAQDLIRVPSINPPGNERPVAEHLAGCLREMGMDVTVTDLTVHPGRPNVVGVWDTGASGPTLLLNGHIDVVPPGDGWSFDPFAATVRDGNLYGRGACDMKGPIACMVAAIEAIAGAPLHGSVIFTGVAGEEADQSGTRQLVADGIRADFGICGEPTGMVPVIAHKGDFYYDITTFGVAAHGGLPHLGVNAVEKMVPVIQGVQALSTRLKEKSHPLCGHPTVSIGLIKGGVITCAVPDRCTISLDRRLIPGESPEEASAEIEGMLQAIAQVDPQFRAEVKTPVMALPMEIDADEPVVLALRRATETVTGKDPGVQGWSATCDANMLVNDAGIPTCIFGPGDIGGQAHKPDEHIAVSSLVDGARAYALAIMWLLQ